MKEVFWYILIILNSKKEKGENTNGLQPSSHLPKHKLMITLIHDKIKPLDQKVYDTITGNISLSSLPCSCGIRGGLRFFGKYRRFFSAPSGKISFSIRRVQCRSCGHTHSLMLSWMIPWSSFSVSDTADMVTMNISDFLEKFPEVNESTVYSVRKKYRQFSARMDSCGLKVLVSQFQDLSSSCFRQLKMQFMEPVRYVNNHAGQIKRWKNLPHFIINIGLVGNLGIIL